SMTTSPNQHDSLAYNLKPSPALADILGSPEPVNRVKASALVWKYIQRHALQRPGKRRQIIVDAALNGMLQHAHLGATTVRGFDQPVITLDKLAEVLNENFDADIYEYSPEVPLAIPPQRPNERRLD